MHLQLWSYNYDPEPTGIGPVSRAWAEGLRDRGHEVEVVAAHPHYPTPAWGSRRTPYREVRNGIPVLRLPLWIGRASSAERLRQELTFMAAQSAAIPFLRRPDILVSASPSFPALLPALVASRWRHTPWLLWLHDILPDGATATGLVKQGLVLSASRRLEQAAYAHADRIVVLSSAFTANLVAKGVAERKIKLIYDPATRSPAEPPQFRERTGPPRLLSMGNIGFSQGLAPLVRSFEADPSLPVKLIITGSGVAAEEVRAEMRTDRVAMLGVVDDDRLERELTGADVALVTQHHAGAEFNIPSKLMNFMAYGLPVLAAVNPAGEVARIVQESGGGWVVDSSNPKLLPARIRAILEDPREVARRGRAAHAYANRHFTRESFAARFDETLQGLRPGHANRGRLRAHSTHARERSKEIVGS